MHLGTKSRSVKATISFATFMNTINIALSRYYPPLILIFKASRLKKVIPLLFLIINGYLISDSAFSLFNVVLPIALVIIVIVLGMQLNVITDAELDKKVKPQLLQWLLSDKQVLTAAIYAEILASFVLLLAILKIYGVEIFLMLFMVTILSLLYSYNFILIKNPANYRLKIFWWGHLTTMWLSYFGLWFSGYLIGIQTKSSIAPIWVMFFLFLSLMDYAVFLSESSNDALEERALGYKTISAIIGKTKACCLGLLIWFGAFMAFLVTIHYIPEDERRFIILLAFSPYALVQSLTCIIMIYLSRLQVKFTVIDTIIDYSFWLSRLATTFILFVMSNRIIS